MGTTVVARVLGVSSGSTNGSSEIVLKAALQAAEDAGAQVEHVRLNDLSIPAEDRDGDMSDLNWFWDRLVESDGLVFSASLVSRTVNARLKLLVDRLLGPNADAAIIEQLVALRRAGTEPTVPFRVDERVLKPRVAGFLAVGGALTPQWRTLALPVMHTLTLSMQIAVVDQVVFGGAGTQQSIVLDEPAIERSRQLGAHVASQLGKPFEDVEYLGDPGLCPQCHLDIIVLRGRHVECATCGTTGVLEADVVRWTDTGTSVITMAERRSHSAEIQQAAQRQNALRSTIDERAATWVAWDRTVRPAASAARV